MVREYSSGPAVNQPLAGLLAPLAEQMAAAVQPEPVRLQSAFDKVFVNQSPALRDLVDACRAFREVAPNMTFRNVAWAHLTAIIRAVDALDGRISQLPLEEQPALPTQPAPALVVIYGADHCTGCLYLGPAAEHQPTDLCDGHTLQAVDITITRKAS